MNNGYHSPLICSSYEMFVLLFFVFSIAQAVAALVKTPLTPRCLTLLMTTIVRTMTLI